MNNNGWRSKVGEEIKGIEEFSLPSPDVTVWSEEVKVRFYVVRVY